MSLPVRAAQAPVQGEPHTVPSRARGAPSWASRTSRARAVRGARSSAPASLRALDVRRAGVSGLISAFLATCSSCSANTSSSPTKRASAPHVPPLGAVPRRARRGGSRGAWAVELGVV
ncbi:hypothetical protein C8R45DRAFT_1115656 [Mycena sanguinolenta]|nr:hypothetical protein C8R45DRAFT_1115656 [Mycena sanguinolenta]